MNTYMQYLLEYQALKIYVSFLRKVHIEYYDRKYYNFNYSVDNVRNCQGNKKRWKRQIA